MDMLRLALLLEDGCPDSTESRPDGGSVFFVRRYIAKEAEEKLTLVHVSIGTKEVRKRVQRLSRFCEILVV